MKKVHHPKFVREYGVFREHYEWFRQRNKGGELSIPAAKETTAELLDFVQRWAGRTGLAEMDAGLRQLGKTFAAVQQRLEVDALEKLLAVLEKRGDCVTGDMLHKATANVMELWKVMPEPLRPEFEKILTDGSGEPLDPVAFFRKSEEDTEQNYRDFEQAWQVFAADWPERATPALRARVDATEGEPLGAWKTELQAEKEKIEAAEVAEEDAI